MLLADVEKSPEGIVGKRGFRLYRSKNTIAASHRNESDELIIIFKLWRMDEPGGIIIQQLGCQAW